MNYETLISIADRKAAEILTAGFNEQMSLYFEMRALLHLAERHRPGYGLKPRKLPKSLIKAVEQMEQVEEE